MAYAYCALAFFICMSVDMHVHTAACNDDMLETLWDCSAYTCMQIQSHRVCVCVRDMRFDVYIVEQGMTGSIGIPGIEGVQGARGAVGKAVRPAC